MLFFQILTAQERRSFIQWKNKLEGLILAPLMHHQHHKRLVRFLLNRVESAYTIYITCRKHSSKMRNDEYLIMYIKYYKNLKLQLHNRIAGQIMMNAVFINSFFFFWKNSKRGSFIYSVHFRHLAC